MKEETRQKISASLKEYYSTPEARESHGRACKEAREHKAYLGGLSAQDMELRKRALELAYEELFREGMLSR